MTLNGNEVTMTLLDGRKVEFSEKEGFVELVRQYLGADAETFVQALFDTATERTATLMAVYRFIEAELKL